MTARRDQPPRLIEQLPEATTILTRPGDREEIEEIEELLDSALAFGETLKEYSSEALEEIQSAHYRVKRLVGGWDLNWPVQPDGSVERFAQDDEDD